MQPTDFYAQLRFSKLVYIVTFDRPFSFPTDILQSQLADRFPDGMNTTLLMLMPSCVGAPRWREKKEELSALIQEAAALYVDELPTAAMLPTELKLWFEHWYVDF